MSITFEDSSEFDADMAYMRSLVDELLSYVSPQQAESMLAHPSIGDEIEVPS